MAAGLDDILVRLSLRVRRALALALVALALSVPATAAETPPRLLASVPPLYSLLAMVSDGVTTPELLIPAGASPHSYTLRPSDARKLATADLILWVGPALEPALAKPIAAEAGRAEVVTLALDPALLHLKDRRLTGVMTPEAMTTTDTTTSDPHLWLDPRNAAMIVERLVGVLSTRDPEHAARYAANGQAAVARLRALDLRLERELAAVHTRPFLTFHDAYQYLEARYGLDNLGFVIANPDHPTVGVRHLSALRALIERDHVRCVFTEPEYEPRLIHPLTEGTAVKVAVLDHLGAKLPLGPEAYFTLMDQLALSLGACLTADAR